MITVYQSSNMDIIFEECRSKILASIEAFEAKGSGWIFVKFVQIKVKVSKYHPTSASSYIPTPIGLRGKTSLLNIRNNDENCFAYCILAAIYGAKHNAARASSYKKYLSRINMAGNIY